MLGRAELLEELKTKLVRPGPYLEPLLLRASGLVHGNADDLLEAADRFAELGLDWHAEQTRGLLAARL